MKNEDVELIKHVLAGDENAFATLVKKYQKQVHALAWRRIGDFHIAEEITQDAFLKVYKRLHTLKNPKQFAGWLYVITSNLCSTWLRKKRIQTQPLEDEDTETSSIQTDVYSKYVVQERAKIAGEAQREVVKKLLAKLPESERTVITLHYFSEMSSTEIGAFLGVSANTIRSRLRRAQQRLQREETMIREALDHFQLSPHLTDNIMREVARLKPAVPSGGKPLVPWIISATGAVLILLILGMGSQYLSRFQQPYSLNAQAEMTVDIIDAPLVRNLEMKPDVRNQHGNATTSAKSENNGQKSETILLAAAQAEGEDVSTPKQQWIPSEPIRGSQAHALITTTEGKLYVLIGRNIYKRNEADDNAWEHVCDLHSAINVSWSDKTPLPLLGAWKDTFYIVLANELYTSKNGGKTWRSVYQWQEGLAEDWAPYELALTEEAFYIVFRGDRGVFRSTDIGKTWKKMKMDELPGGYPYPSFTAMPNTLFAATETGLYRWNANSWQRLEFPIAKAIVPYSVTATKERLYVMATVEIEPWEASEGRRRTWWLFRSTDYGNSWTDITPTDAWSVKGWPPRLTLVAAGGTFLMMERGLVRSTDSGDTWLPPESPSTSPLTIPLCSGNSTAVALSEHVFYVNSNDGLHRTADGGKSWNRVNIVQDEIFIDNLVGHKGSDNAQNRHPILYARFEDTLVRTIDAGKSWKMVQMEIPMTTPNRDEPPVITHIIKSGGILYAKGADFRVGGKTLLYRIAADGRTIVPIQGMPSFNARPLMEKLFQIVGGPPSPYQKKRIEHLPNRFPGAAQFFKQLAQGDMQQNPHSPEAMLHFELGFTGGPFAVSDDTFYMEYNFKLFRWKRGDTEWSDTGLEETVELSPDIARKTLKLAVSGNTVYAGKRDGHLLVSLNEGDNWVDFTPALPFPVKTFKEIGVAGPTVYVATDAGVAASINGRSWHPVTDATGMNLIMEHLAVNGTTLYGVTAKTGIYRLENGTWQQVVSEIPDNVTSLAAERNTLYVGTENQGMLHFNFEK